MGVNSILPAHAGNKIIAYSESKLIKQLVMHQLRHKLCHNYHGDTLKRSPVVCDYGGGHFRLMDKGLTYIGMDKDGHPLPSRWICSPLYVVAKTRDAQSGEWGRLLEWQDDDGITHQWAMPLAL
jgi:hypothetical protein